MIIMIIITIINMIIKTIKIINDMYSKICTISETEQIVFK